MKIAIHHRKGSFSDHWINYCKDNGIDFETVNAFDDDIIVVLLKKKFTHFMWHINHSSLAELTLFPNLMNSLDKAGIKTFPNHNTRWHFDDKVAQKYLLESIGAPMVTSNVYYEKKTAMEAINNIDLPIVAKLKRGAGATNVKLLHDKNQAIDYIQKMFSTGINPNSGVLGNMDAKLRLAKKVKNPIKLVKKVINHIGKVSKEVKNSMNEKGYFYFQEFLQNNDYDTRVIIVGNKAVAFKRFNREGDFRASGSGKASFENIDIKMIEIAFEVTKKIGAQSLAYDFIYNKLGEPVIIEISFGFGQTISDTAEGYWTDDLQYYKYSLNLQVEILKNHIYGA